MDKYINYLLADIAAASANVPAFALSELDEEEDFISLEEEEQLAPRQKLSDRLKLRPEWFPPADRLTEEHQDRVVDALLICLHSFNFVANFPDGLPTRERYQVLTDYLQQEVPILTYNSWQIDFCDYNPKTCPFGGQYCQCQMYERWLGRLQEDDEEAPPNGTDNTSYRLPGFLFDDWLEEAGSTYGHPYKDEEDEDQDDWDDDDELDDNRFLDFRDFDPGPDDDGLWN